LPPRWTSSARVRTLSSSGIRAGSQKTWQHCSVRTTSPSSSPTRDAVGSRIRRDGGQPLGLTCVSTTATAATGTIPNGSSPSGPRAFVAVPAMHSSTTTGRASPLRTHCDSASCSGAAATRRRLHRGDEPQLCVALAADTWTRRQRSRVFRRHSRESRLTQRVSGNSHARQFRVSTASCSAGNTEGNWTWGANTLLRGRGVRNPELPMPIELADR